MFNPDDINESEFKLNMSHILKLNQMNQFLVIVPSQRDNLAAQPSKPMKFHHRIVNVPSQVISRAIFLFVRKAASTISAAELKMHLLWQLILTINCHCFKRE